jgi:xyloglucan fucosyltransferase
LIASLYPDYYEMLRSRYYEHPAKGGVRVSVFQPTHEKVQVTGQHGHNQKALAEIFP